MQQRMDVPPDDELTGLPVAVLRGIEPWVTTLRATADDGSTVDFTWDEVAGSIAFCVLQGEAEMTRVEREMIKSVRVYEAHGGLYFEADISTGELSGTLSLGVGRIITFRDALLRR